MRKGKKLDARRKGEDAIAGNEVDDLLFRD